MQGLRCIWRIPVRLPQYAGLKYSNDFSDARQLAHLLRLGILPTGYIYPKDERALRDLLRRRLLLVRQRTLHHLSLQSLIARHSGQRLSTLQIKHLRKSQIADYLQGPLCWVERSPTRHDVGWRPPSAGSSRNYSIISSPARLSVAAVYAGVGPVLGTTIALETGTIERFASPGNYASYARCVKSEKISNGSAKARATKRTATSTWPGRLWRRHTMAAIWNPRIKQYYQRKQTKAHILVAKKAVANKLARACYHMLKRDEKFDVSRAFS